ncbi:MAG: hypothetical protein ACNI3A_17815 [Desulfovibrio sp.]|uniref:hypothetical protein n=1 Tax=Desulfovibrio sp. 7SRBS1 TaxID=3378064 RepID=UPI003B3DE8CC
MKIYEAATYMFDPLHAFWEKKEVQQKVAGGLMMVFLASLVGIELNRQGLLPPSWAAVVPTRHFYAVDLAFTLVLIMEVIGLIFVLPCSVSKAVAKQLEILALIFLRESFKELVVLPEPVTLAGNLDTAWNILADGVGALIIFLLLGIYSRAIRQTAVMSGETRYKFVASKKMVSLALVIGFAGLGVYNGLLVLQGQKPFHFFEAFYTVLIFSDILLVLISQQFLPSFHAVLRNSGYAVSTLLLRLSLTAPGYYNVIIGVSATLFALSLTLIYNKFYASPED